MSFSFYINNCSPTGGPGIFGGRLKKQFERNGHRFVDPYISGEAPQKNISIIQGKRIDASEINILRLDGLYLDSENPNNDQMNAGIFNSFDESDHIVYQSEFSKDVYHAFHKNKPFTIIANGIDQQDFLSNVKPIKYENPIFSKYEKICVASASWRRHKRLEETIEALRPQD